MSLDAVIDTHTWVLKVSTRISGNFPSSVVIMQTFVCKHCSLQMDKKHSSDTISRRFPDGLRKCDEEILTQALE